MRKISRRSESEVKKIFLEIEKIAAVSNQIGRVLMEGASGLRASAPEAKTLMSGLLDAVEAAKLGKMNQAQIEIFEKALASKSVSADDIVSAFSKLNPQQKEAALEILKQKTNIADDLIQRIRGSVSTSDGSVSAVRSGTSEMAATESATMVAGTGRKALNSQELAQTIVDGINKNPSSWLEKYKTMSPQRKAFAERLWKSHPESKNFSSIEDFAKSKIKNTAAPAGVETGRVAVIGDAISDAERRVADAAAEIIFDPSAAGRSFEEMNKIVAESSSSPELRQALIKTLTDFRNPRQEAAFKALLESKGIKIPDDIIAEASRIRGGVPVSSPVVLTPVGEVVSDAGGAITKADEAAAAGTKADEALTPGRAAEVATNAGSTTKRLITSETTMDEAIEIISKKMGPLGKSETAALEKLVKNPSNAAKLISAEKSGKFKKFNSEYGDPELDAILTEAGKVIKSNPKAAAQALTEAAQSSAPAAKAINLRRAAKITGAVAAGLTGIALISYLWSGDEEEEEKITQSDAASPVTGDSSFPQGGRGNSDYETASRIMMEKGYLSSPQSSWTREFDSGFRRFVDAATANGRGLPKTNLVGGQSWVEAAPLLGFTADKNGALSAVSVLARFIPSTGTSPTTTTPTTPEIGRGDQTGSGAGTASPKVQVLADIISRLYNDRLVEGGGGIFSRELKQTQSFVDAVGGASPGGYVNAAKVLLSRNPNLERLLPEQTIGDVLSKRTVKSHPAYNAIKESQKSIHQLFEAANPGIINPRRRRATENVKEYLGSAAGGNWKQASSNENRFVKLAEDRKARIKAEVLGNLTPAERATMRRLRMRGA